MADETGNLLERLKEQLEDSPLAGLILKTARDTLDTTKSRRGKCRACGADNAVPHPDYRARLRGAELLMKLATMVYDAKPAAKPAGRVDLRAVSDDELDRIRRRAG